MLDRGAFTLFSAHGPGRLGGGGQIVRERPTAWITRHHTERTDTQDGWPIPPCPNFPTPINPLL